MAVKIDVYSKLIEILFENILLSLFLPVSCVTLSDWTRLSTDKVTLLPLRPQPASWRYILISNSVIYELTLITS